jgi:hypothetical protein
MADTEKREVQHYKVFELNTLVYTDRSKDDMSIRVDVVPTAIFDTRDALMAYIAAAKAEIVSEVEVPKTMPTVPQVFVREEWKEQEPKADGFNLPFNPEYVAPVVEEAAPVEAQADNAEEAAA